MSKIYIEPILQPLANLSDPVRFQDTLLGFDHVRIHEHGRASIIAHIMDCDEADLNVFTQTPRMLSETPRHIMGIVNVTPDSFSDGGQFETGEAAIAHARKLVEEGATILDFGAESTRPGSETIPAQTELLRLEDIFEALDSFGVATSIDTRKALVADAAIGDGVTMINDVSAMTFDPQMAETVAHSDSQICLMHAIGDPKTMQDDPQYENVLLEVYDFLESRIEFALSQGIEKNRIVIDPGIGFGKTLEHNLLLMKHVAVFHNLGVPILVGASRKRFINEISPSQTNERIGGSLSVALDLARKGVQIIRVHDVKQTAQALKVQDYLLEQL